jgi:hypothetical protein
MRGAVYILSNSAMPGLLKIGYTTKTAEERSVELFTTGVPARFRVEFEAVVDNAPGLERLVHSALAAHRHSDDREWFSVSLKTAVERIRTALVSPEAGHVWGERLSAIARREIEADEASSYLALVR